VAFGTTAGVVEEYTPERIELPADEKRRSFIQPMAADAGGANSGFVRREAGLWIAQRRVPVRIQVLAPNQRPCK